MNKRILVLSMALFSTVFYMNAQSGFGVKGGLSYNSNGELNEIGQTIKNEGKGKSGYNVGIYGKIGLGPIYLRPELVYTKTTSEYTLNTGGTEDYKIARLDMPVLVGLKLIGPISVFAGPAFQYTLTNDFKGIEYSSIENDFTVGFNFGAGVELGRLGLDIRYERGFNKNEATFIENTTTSYRLDSRPEQIIFSLSYRLSGSSK